MTKNARLAFGFHQIHVLAPPAAASGVFAQDMSQPRPDTWETPEDLLVYAERRPQALVALEAVWPFAEREFATFQRAKVTQYLVDPLKALVTGNAEPRRALRQGARRRRQRTW